MCWKAICKKCKKITWEGCGKHIEQIKKNVPANEWCICDIVTEKADKNTNNK
jgi:hypothetical protein